MAPGAEIFLVEAQSASAADLFSAVDMASAKVAGAGGGEVSMSWGGSEFSAETTFDAHLQKSTIVYFASTGDSPGVEYPAASPFLLAAGGTSTVRALPSGTFLKEVAWQDAGSGVSAFEARPVYQNSVSSIVGGHRGTPDLSFDSSPNTGVWVWANSTGTLGSGWFIVGGTSVASPALAGIVNSAGHFFTNSATELASIYRNRAVVAEFRDITLGNCGPYGSLFAAAGYDLCTGVGSDQGTAGK
jgi:subtilase family serine protease